MTPTHRGSRLEIREKVIRQNVLALKKIAGNGFFCPMVKANAYGHGVEKVAQIMKDLKVESLGVATWDEALELRELGFDREILVFSRTHDLEEAELAVQGNFIPVLSRFEDLKLFEKVGARQKRKLPVHVKFDTGIHRMGFSAEQVDEVLKALKSADFLRLSGVLTHLSHSEDAAQKEGRSSKQIDRFLSLKKSFEVFQPKVHCLNSMGMLERSKMTSDISQLGCRPGISLYGAVKDARLSSLPAMRLVSQVDHLQYLPRGEGVSYGWTWKAERDSLVGVIPFGYGDGYPRGLSNKAQMLIHGQRVPVVGTVCMDYALVDLTAHEMRERIQVGDEVVILGEQKEDVIFPWELAEWNDSIAYEILVNLGLRKSRVEAV